MQSSIQEANAVAAASAAAANQYNAVVKAEQLSHLYPQQYIVQTTANGHPAQAEYVQAAAAQVSVVVLWLRFVIFNYPISHLMSVIKA